MKLHAATALLSDGRADDVLLEVDGAGFIGAVTPGVSDRPPSYLVGSWTTDPDSGSYPVYVTIVPALLHSQGLLQNLAITIWRRCADVASLMMVTMAS